MATEKRPPHPTDRPTDSEEEVGAFSNLGYANLGNMLAKGSNPAARIKSEATMAGHPIIGSGQTSDGSFTLNPSSDGEGEVKTQDLKVSSATKHAQAERVIRRGNIYRHKKRGTRMTVIQANCGVNNSGEDMHLVVESKTGKSFKVVGKNLE